MIVGVVTAVVVISLLILGTGYYIQFLRRPALPVATVNGHAIKWSEWKQAQQLRNFDLQVQLQHAQQQAATDPNAKAEVTRLQNELGRSNDLVVSDLIDQYLLSQDIPKLEAQGAPAADVTVTPDEVATRLRQWKKGSFITDDNSYQHMLQALKVSDKDLRAYLADQLLRDKVRASVTKDVAADQPEVKARKLVLADKAKADEDLGKLKQGTDFDMLAGQDSTDTATKATGGEMGWVARGEQGATFDSFAFADPPPQPFAVSEVLQDNTRYDIFQIQDRANQRPLTSTQLENLKDKQFASWLSDLEKGASIVRYPKNQS